MCLVEVDCLWVASNCRTEYQKRNTEKLKQRKKTQLLEKIKRTSHWLNYSHFLSFSIMNIYYLSYIQKSHYPCDLPSIVLLSPLSHFCQSLPPCTPSVSHQANKDEAKLDDISVRNRVEAPQKRVDDRDSCRDNDGKVGRQPENNAHRSPWKTHRTLNQRRYLKIWWERYDLTL